MNFSCFKEKKDYEYELYVFDGGNCKIIIIAIAEL